MTPALKCCDFSPKEIPRRGILLSWWTKYKWQPPFVHIYNSHGNLCPSRGVSVIQWTRSSIGRRGFAFWFARWAERKPFDETPRKAARLFMAAVCSNNKIIVHLGDVFMGLTEARLFLSFFPAQQQLCPTLQKTNYRKDIQYLRHYSTAAMVVSNIWVVLVPDKKSYVLIWTLGGTTVTLIL